MKPLPFFGRLFLILFSISLFAACADEESGSGLPAADGDEEIVDGDEEAGGNDEIPIEQPDTPEYANYFIITLPQFLDAANAFKDYRNQTGYMAEVHLLSDLTGDPDQPITIRNGIHNLIRDAKENLDEETSIYVLLIGDAPDADDIDTLFPPMECENMIGSCYTDNEYGDLDGDTIPEAAVGRIPCRTNEEAIDVLHQIQAHESEYNVGLWNRRISLYTGEAGFGAAIDNMLETAVFDGISKLNHAFDVFGGYDNPNSDYWYHPFEDLVIHLLNEGSILTVYIGHGSAGWTQGLDVDRLSLFSCQNRKPFMFFFACSNGVFAGETRSMAEEVLFKTDGPVASFAATGTSHPYGNAILPYELQRAIFDYQPLTIGQAIIETKRQAIENTDDEFREMMDSFAKIEVPVEDQETLRYEHNNLYNLLGDPATLIRYPLTRAEFDPLEGSIADGEIVVYGRAPMIDDGTAYVTFESEIGDPMHELEEIDPDNPDAETVQSNWQKAIDMVLAETSVPVEGEIFEARLQIPDDLPMDRTYWIKVYADDGVKDCIGAKRAR